MKTLWLALLFLTVSKLFSQALIIKGSVFVDLNGNAIRDAKETGLAAVVVSDQYNTTKTDNNGNFILSTNSEFPYMMISLPNGYQGQMYHPKAAVMAFPLQKQEQRKEFTFIHASDTHVDSLNLPRMGRFRSMADSTGADFVVISGDLILDALRVNEATASAYYRMYLDEIAKFNMPVYSGVGNHEIFGIERDKSLVSSEHPLYGKKMFRHFLGPNYYSFNYGGMHFIALDGVDYQNLYYFGGIDSLQLRWLEQDLKEVPVKTPIVTFNHIPLVSPGFSFQDFDNDVFYGPQLLMQGNKLEHRHIVYNFNEVQKRIGNRPFPLALSGHYHAAQESFISGSNTLFAQTSAISRPDSMDYHGFKMRSGFTLYRVKDGKITAREIIPLNFP
ncbi:MAG: metallophosphoesterase N-terminal domain-containing protein [Flavobacteriaceae bacterium]